MPLWVQTVERARFAGNKTITGSLTVSGSGQSVITGPLRVGAATGGAGIFTVPVAPTASANYGLVSLGSGPFDGATAGFFAGHASGTVLAINAASGFGGNLLDLQVAGASKLSVSPTLVALGGSVPTITFTDPTLRIERGGNGGLLIHSGDPYSTYLGHGGASVGISTIHFESTQSGATLLTPSAVAGGAIALTVTPGAHTAVIAEVPDLLMAAHTITITGAYTAQRFSKFGQPTISAATALTVDDAATVYIADSPAAAGAGPATITRPWSLWIDGGNARFDGDIYRDTTKIIGAQGALVADASGGAIIDVEARTALNALLARLRTHGLIAT